MADRIGEGGSSKKKTTTTGSVSRAIGGVGTFIDTHHEGGLKRRVENTLDSRLDRDGATNMNSQVEDRGEVVWSEAHGASVRIKNGKIVEVLKREKPL